MGCFSRMARLARASRFCDQAKPSWTFRRSVHRQISEDSWFLCALCNKNCCSWSRAGSYPLSRVKKYRPSRLSINVSCCCYYYYVRAKCSPWNCDVVVQRERAWLWTRAEDVWWSCLVVMNLPFPQAMTPSLAELHEGQVSQDNLVAPGMFWLSICKAGKI